ncbi:helix-turn-helix domain-containing protein [Pantanalinema sp. GBBB05]|uniref:helix-turn-helix domain-containing protein n=1 Tax=Pantanalinema sp. GBBB05 TaxID=2604139 RepID=UPI001DCE3D5A|nr:helix-turn-helix domain-containing protein [Pantanalinema sp. GBBB05]
MSHPDQAAVFTSQLQNWMQQAGMTSFRALSRAAGVSRWQVEQLRQGNIAQMRVEILLKLSQALQISLTELLTPFTANHQADQALPSAANLEQQLTDLRQEYDRLQTQLAQQRQELLQEFQQSSVQMLESLLLQLPTAAYAAQQNPQAPAVKLLPLLRPIDQLLTHWGIDAIATVGTEAPYDPQQHQLMEGFAEPNDPVKIRYTGYRQGDRLLYRAKVSPVNR